MVELLIKYKCIIYFFISYASNSNSNIPKILFFFSEYLTIYINFVCKKAKSKREELEKCIKVLKRKSTIHYQDKEKLRNTVLKNADVVFCTLNGSGCLDLHFLAKQKGHFKCVIVDEACQCTEPDTLIPLRFKSSKLVLVGDPLQLPATVVSKKATQLGFHRSLFERIYMYYRSQGTEANHVYMLNTQYRMHPEICRFPSQHFYNNRLETHRSDQEKPFPFKPYLVFDVINGREECNEKDISNRAECDMVKELILSVVHLEKIRIGIVTPYRKQKELLMDCVERLNIGTNQGIKEKIMISTVDGFQGQEKDIIILSCVRAKGRGNNIGFVANRNRMNVALTRAKLALYVVGHLETLKTNPDWCALINDANDRKLIFKVRDRDYRQAANYCEKENRTSKRGSASSDQSHDSYHHSHDSDHRSHDSDQGTRGRHRIKANHSGQNRSNNKSVTLSDRLGELEDGEIRSQSNSPQLNEDSEPSTSSQHLERTKQAIMAKYPGGPLIRHMDGLPYEQWDARKTKSNQPKNSSNGHKQLKRKRSREEDLGNKSKGEERDSNKMKEHRGITAHTSFDSSVNRQQVHLGHKRHKSNNITTFKRRRHRSDSITIKPVEKRKRHRSGELHTSTCKMHGDQGQQNSTASAVRASTPKLQPLLKGRRIAHTARSELPKSGQTSSNSDGQSKSSTLQLGNDEVRKTAVGYLKDRNDVRSTLREGSKSKTEMKTTVQRNLASKSRNKTGTQGNSSLACSLAYSSNSSSVFSLESNSLHHGQDSNAPQITADSAAGSTQANRTTHGTELSTHGTEPSTYGTKPSACGTEPSTHGTEPSAYSAEPSAHTIDNLYSPFSMEGSFPESNDNNDYVVCTDEKQENYEFENLYSPMSP
ncbi:uncharacterized protein [Antedon mediterranea]|uniref:uncharacterized protein isoform X2 n=1 Tax=Antedon mediterranea TaxID=105859 RepID=UPI003AF6E86D